MANGFLVVVNIKPRLKVSQYYDMKTEQRKKAITACPDQRVPRANTCNSFRYGQEAF